jgi:glycosyltransferase involved in cell wall biosynthesis
MKKLSIIIPCYNEGENIHSLLSRYSTVVAGRDDIEIILVNDGSKDNSKEILEERKKDFDFLKVIHVYPNGGYGNAVVTGLREAKGELIGWTHGDLQAPPEDILTALSIIDSSKEKQTTYVKGRRHNRPFADVFFTLGMSLFESVLFRMKLNDINAQPNIFHRSFFDLWENAPKDFSLDLYAFVMAKKNNFTMVRFPVSFNPRLAGVSSWNTSWGNKYKFIKRTVFFSLSLIKILK